jgi:hypothetical protein
LITLKTFGLASFYFLLAYMFLAPVTSVDASDKENCLMCHKYRFIGRIGTDGKVHNYNVDESLFHNSVHRNIPCSDCHTYIKKLPHDPVTENVNCANKCHVKPPFTQERFSHEKLIDKYNSSAHGIKAEDPDKLIKEKPNCKYCHLNPLYTKISEETVPYEETLRRCINCHVEKGVIMAYKHITHRLRKKTSRSRKDIVELCSKCHQNVELMKTLNASEKALTAVETYNRSIHGKLVRLGSQSAADCISCHSSNALHDIYKSDDKRSTVYKNNLRRTCHDCHTDTNDWFLHVAVHPSIEHEESPFIRLASSGLKFALYGTVFGLVGLMLFETYGRRRNGVKLLLKNGTSWHGKTKQSSEKQR